MAHDILRERLLKKAGLIKGKQAADLDLLREKNWCPEFEEMMRNRLVMGALRYNDGNPWPQPEGMYDYVAYLRTKLDLYEKERNTELLVDVANMAMLEFVFGTHPDRHFEALDDHGHHYQR